MAVFRFTSRTQTMKTTLSFKGHQMDSKTMKSQGLFFRHPSFQRTLLTLLLLPLLGALHAADAPMPQAKPNILLIYSDDHGWADLGIQGVDKDIRTPHIDQLAREGVRFPRGYVSSPQCVPSRAGIITGRYQQRFGVEDNKSFRVVVQTEAALSFLDRRSTERAA
jgi:hypothetical protein